MKLQSCILFLLKPKHFYIQSGQQMWDGPNEDQRGKIYNCTYSLWLSFLKVPFLCHNRKKINSQILCPIFYRPSTPITVHSNALCSFLACKYRAEYCVVCPNYLMPWLKGAPNFKVERNALLCFSPSSLKTLAGSDKLQTEVFLSVCFQTMVILNLDREDRKQRPRNSWKSRKRKHHKWIHTNDSLSFKIFSLKYLTKESPHGQRCCLP